jgi:hypothetical protein
MECLVASFGLNKRAALELGHCSRLDRDPLCQSKDSIKHLRLPPVEETRNGKADWVAAGFILKAEKGKSENDSQK